MAAGSVRLWLRWSWRDLRQRWLLVTALALVIALGTGSYAGLGGTTAWRIASNDASYALMRMHDLRVTLPAGGFVPTGALTRAAHGIPDADAIAVAQERLIAPTLLDASASVLVPADVVGLPVPAGVDRLYVQSGRGLRASDTGRAVGVLEPKFAAVHDLPATGRVRLGGGATVRYVGTGYTPDYLRVLGRSGQLLGETGFAVLFLPLRSAQVLTGHVGHVNDLVLRLARGADVTRVRSQLAAAVAPLGGTVTTRAEDPVHRSLYEDARNDQTTWNMFALLILLGAAFAAFNLVTRMIEAQRRELGVGMALGVPARVLTLRPLLVGVQIAVLGVLAGLGVGWLLGRAMAVAMEDLLPLPVWQTPFQTGRFAQAALLGLLIPLLACVLPLRRALRLQPVEAIRTGAYGSRAHGSRLSVLLAKAHLPGRTYVAMSLRNVVRAPRRTLLTALGVAAAITSMVAVLGLLDTFVATGQANTTEVTRSSPDRLVVALDGFYPRTSARVRAITRTAGVARAEEQLRVPAQLSAHGHQVDVVVDLLDLHSPVWAPTLLDGTRKPGIVLSEKAARDLGVKPGDRVTALHPVRAGTGFRLETTRLPVSALHPNPLRPFAYMDASAAGVFGLAGVTNQVVVVPRPGTGQATLQRALFAQQRVAGVEPASGLAKLIDDELGGFTEILRIIEVAVLLLALLIAFNAASISADERAREHATMFAFGLPQRVVVAMAVAENAVIGLLGTMIGVGAGFGALKYLVAGFDQVMPDLMVSPTLTAGTVLATLVLGVLVVALAPLLNVRKQSRMDVPATLRVVE
ncbi:MAG: ABC transporter permease [Nocardioidaceae bacterium]